MGTNKTISEIAPCNCSYIEGGFNCLECEFCGEIDIENQDIQCNYEKP